jgi:hypothetical protein
LRAGRWVLLEKRKGRRQRLVGLEKMKDEREREGERESVAVRQGEWDRKYGRMVKQLETGVEWQIITSGRALLVGGRNKNR